MTLHALREYEIPGAVAADAARGGLPRLVLTTSEATAEVYLHGAHVTHFQRHGEPPILFMSRNSRFEAGQAIRGGVPICFPWFGARTGGPAHGLARLTTWRVVGSAVAPDGAVSVEFALPPLPDLAEWATLDTTFTVTLSHALTMSITTRHRAEAARPARAGAVRVETCLHSYFDVGEIGAVTLTGLEGAPFDDFAFGANGARRAGQDAALSVDRETNRVYPDHTATIDIRDAALGRVIRVEKSGSNSTVIWNPWTTQRMPDDFDQAEYRRMICVESGNVKQNATRLAPGEATTLTVTISSR